MRSKVILIGFEFSLRPLCNTDKVIQTNVNNPLLETKTIQQKNCFKKSSMSNKKIAFLKNKKNY